MGVHDCIGEETAMTDERRGLKTYASMGYERTDYEPYSATSYMSGYFGLHCHDFYEFYIYFRGLEYYCVEDSVYEMKPYTLLIHPPFTLHGLMGHQTRVNYERAWLYVSTDMMRQLGCGQTDLVRFFRECANQGRLRLDAGEERARKLQGLANEMMQHIGDVSPMGRWQNFSRVMEWVRLVCDTAECSAVSGAPVVVNETIQRILSYVNEHFTEPLALQSLARQFGVSVSYLSHEFTAYTGRSVYEYVLYRRVQLAKEMICAGKPLTEVAYATGFNDYSGFLRAFQKEAGQAPSEYRKGTRR